MSKIQRRIHHEYMTAVAPNGRDSTVESEILLVGNSLFDLPRLMALITPRPKALPTGNVREVATMRLRALKAALGAYGARVLFIVSPALGDAHAAELEEAGRVAGVPVVSGWSAADFSPGDFSDGFHLNAEGARRYTNRLAIKLRQVLNGPTA